MPHLLLLLLAIIFARGLLAAVLPSLDGRFLPLPTLILKLLRLCGLPKGVFTFLLL